jgi:hypothetical protein
LLLDDIKDVMEEVMKYISKRFNLQYYLLGVPIEDNKFGINLHIKFPDDADQEIIKNLSLRMSKSNFSARLPSPENDNDVGIDPTSFKKDLAQK